ncbi:MAG: protein phosphatase 2C domain-containing protein [Terrimicrobiaceae bacterium]
MGDRLPNNLAWTGHSDRGKVRTNNEDSFLCVEIDAREVRYLGKVGETSLETNDYLFAVSDGMGGAMAGEFASKIAVEKITKLMPQAFQRSASGLTGGHAEVLEELFVEIHEALTYMGACYEECRGMGATLTLGWITPGWLHFAHIGDSRIYYLPGSGEGIRQLSHDNTHVGWLFRQGKINEREARSHPGRSSLQRALGAGNQFVDPQVGSVGLEVGDRYLLCTDGLVDGLTNKQLEQLICEPTPKEKEILPAVRLVQASLARSGRDNTTGLVLEFT